MCTSTVDIQSATAEIRRGRREKEEEETTGQKYNGLPISKDDHNKVGIVKTIRYTYLKSCRQHLHWPQDGWLVGV